MRQSLANSMMYQFVNLFDYWYRPHWGDESSPPAGFITNVDAMVALARNFTSPGSYADAQQLEICNFGEGNEFAPDLKGMTLEEYRAQYTIWAMLASPLVLSADLRTLPSKHPECFEMIINQELLAISQDPSVRPGTLVHQAVNSTDASVDAVRSWNIVEQVWIRELQGGDRAICFFNRDEMARNMTVGWEQLGLKSQPAEDQVRDVWRTRLDGVTMSTVGMTALVGQHSVVLLRISGSKASVSFGAFV